mgnify:CR=1 FL=1
MGKKANKKLKKLWEDSVTNGKEHSELRIVVKVMHNPDITLGNGKLGRVERHALVKGGKDVDKFSYNLHCKLAEILEEDIGIFMEAVTRETIGEEPEWYDKELSTV